MFSILILNQFYFVELLISEQPQHAQSFSAA